MHNRSGLTKEEILSLVPHLIVVSYAASILVNPIRDPMSADRVRGFFCAKRSLKE